MTAVPATDVRATGVLRAPGGVTLLYLPHFMLFSKIINFFIFHLFYLPLPFVTGTMGLYEGYAGYDGCSLYPVTGVYFH